jgi:hypothetical protein
VTASGFNLLEKSMESQRHVKRYTQAFTYIAGGGFAVAQRDGPPRGEGTELELTLPWAKSELAPDLPRSIREAVGPLDHEAIGGGLQFVVVRELHQSNADARSKIKDA